MSTEPGNPPVSSTAMTEDGVAAWYQEAHRTGRFLGTTYERYVAELTAVVPGWKKLKTIDFGCGPRGGLYEVCRSVVPYDPYCDKYSDSAAWPARYDVFFSADVFEHMSEKQAAATLKLINKLGIPYVFLAVATRPAKKSFPSGENVHRLICDGSWWAKFAQHWLSKSYSRIYYRNETVSKSTRKSNSPETGFECVVMAYKRRKPRSSNGRR